MAEPCYGSLQVCALRVSELLASGQPDQGLTNGYVTESLITVDIGIELSEGDDLEKKNGCGSICQTFKGCDKIKRATLGIALCELDIQLASKLVGGDLFTSGAQPLGWEFPHIDDDCPNGVCFEFWTKAWDNGQQAVAATLSNDVAYWHWVFPKAQFQLDDMTVENDFMEFSLSGFGEENAQMPAAGPFDDWPAYVETDGGVTAVGAVFLDNEIPDATCEFIPVPVGS